MMTCPQCGRQTSEGRFCERCGASLPEAPCVENVRPVTSEPGTLDAPTLVERPVPRSTVPEADIDERLERATASIRAAESRIEREAAKVDLYANQRGEPTLAYDRTCSFFENMSGIMRFLFNPQGGGDMVENVVIEFSNSSLQRPLVQRFRHASRQIEFSVQFPAQAVGLQSWDVSLAYQSSRRKHALAGQFQSVVRPVDSRGRAAGNYHISFNTTVGNVGHASDVNVYSSGADGLANLVQKDDPFEEMQRIARSDERLWTGIPLSDDNAVVDLPEMPSAAKTEHVTLDFGNRRIHLFAGRAVRFGRSRELNDFVLRPPAGAGEDATRPYRMVSRQHCLFEQAGASIDVSDGSRDAAGVVQPSSGGTFWNDDRMRDVLKLESGASGTLAFGAPSCAGGLSLRVKACAPTKACATCPHSNIRWCGEGTHPSLVLRRLDGIAECYVALWSCFWLGEAEPTFEGTVIFRKDGAFAFRSGSRSGWLVPGTTIQTDFGPVTIN